MKDEHVFAGAIGCAIGLLFVTLFSVRCLDLARRFVSAKIANDASIAADTKRLADAVESLR